MITLCEKCGAELHIGDHPFCPHGRSRGAIQRDEIPGGLVVQNYGPEPIRFDSHSERRAYMKANGLQEKEKFCPTPGTDIDPAGIPNPAGYMDPQTLENARILLSRNGARQEQEPDISETVIQGRFNGELTGRDAKAIAEGDTARMSRLGRRIENG